MMIEDVHNFGADYDKTLIAWFANFHRNWPRLSKNLPRSSTANGNITCICAPAYSVRAICNYGKSLSLPAMMKEAINGQICEIQVSLRVKFLTLHKGYILLLWSVRHANNDLKCPLGGKPYHWVQTYTGIGYEK